MTDNKKNTGANIITKEICIIEPRWTGKYYHYHTKDMAGMEGTAYTVADSDEWLQKFKFGIPSRVMTCDEYKTWTLNYAPQKWRGLFTAMKQGYVLLNFRNEQIFPDRVQSSRRAMNGMSKPYVIPRIHDGYIVVPIDIKNRSNPPKIELTIYKKSH
jgi:hypothetical protein